MPDVELLDTRPLRDQRTMVYVTDVGSEHKTAEDVAGAWQRWADEQGLPIRRRQSDYSTDLKTSRKTVEVYISGGKWIGDCPGCRGGVAAWPMNPQGCCLDCGTIYPLHYPPRADVLELATLMQVRPEEQRNYFPHQGETMADVRRTNAVFQYADTTSGVVSIAALRDTLAPHEFEKLKKAGII